MYVTNCRSLKGLYRTFVLPTDPHFCEHIFWQSPKGFTKMWDLHIFFFFFFVAMLPCDNLIWMKYFQICHFPGRIIEFTALKTGTFVLPTDPHFCEHIFWQSPKGFTKMWDLHIFFFFFFCGNVTLWQPNMNEIFSNMSFSWQDYRIHGS